MRYAIMLVVILTFSAFCSAQTTWYVPDDFPTIQSAISDPFVTHGDTILVRPNSYNENLDFLGKAITVRSTNGAEVTLIDGMQLSCVVLFSHQEGLDSILEGFTLTNGKADTSVYPLLLAGGIYCYDGSSPTIRNNRIVGNSSNHYGSGISIYNSSPEILDNVISNNASNYFVRGGGICCRIGSPLIKGNTITDNYASYGGGIYCFSATPRIEDNDISQNEVSNDGGGIYLDESSATVTKNTISSNVTGDSYEDSGGGIYCERDNGSLISENAITNNRSFAGGGVHITVHSATVISNNFISRNRFNGIYCNTHSDSVIEYNTIQSNISSTGGGIIINSNSHAAIRYNTISNHVVSFDGAGIYCGGQSEVELKGNKIIDNIGTVMTPPDYSAGGGIYCEASTLSSCDDLIANCGAYKGAGIYSHESEVTVHRSTLTGNSSMGGGGGIRHGYGSLFISSSVFSDNHVLNGYSPCGGGVFCYEGTEPVVITNSVFHANNGGEYGGGFYFTGSDAVIVNNTFVDNYCNDEGGGVTGFLGDLAVMNCIFYGNEAPLGSEIALMTPRTLQISHSCVEGGQLGIHIDPGGTLHWGEGMLDRDPEFVDRPRGNLHLTMLSPCIDAGNNMAPSLPSRDFEGDPRVMLGLAPGYGKGLFPLGGGATDSVVDMGADELCSLKFKPIDFTVY